MDNISHFALLHLLFPASLFGFMFACIIESRSAKRILLIATIVTATMEGLFSGGVLYGLIVLGGLAFAAVLAAVLVKIVSLMLYKSFTKKYGPFNAPGISWHKMILSLWD